MDSWAKFSLDTSLKVLNYVGFAIFVDALRNFPLADISMIFMFHLPITQYFELWLSSDHFCVLMSFEQFWFNLLCELLIRSRVVYLA